MKKKYIKILWLICLSLIWTFSVGQKPLDVSVNIFPPYPTNLHQYADDFRGYNFTITNYAEAPQSIYLSVQLVSENGVRIGFNPAFRPSEPIVLESFQTLMMTGLDLEESYGGISGDDLTIEGLDVAARLSGQLPEGNYSLCVFAHDFDTGILLSTGCSFSYTATFATIPEIIYPRDGDIVPQPEVTPLNIVWSPPSQGADINGNMEYVLKIIDLTDNPITDIEGIFMSGGVPVILEKTVFGLNYLYDAEGDDVPLISGHTYGLRIQAVTDNDIPFENQGFSEIVTFTIGDNQVLVGTNEDEPLPTDCESRCNLPVISDQVGITTIAGLTSVRMGHFVLENMNVNYNGTHFSGTAEIRLQFLNNIRINVSLSNVKINANGQIFEGTLNAVQDNDPEIADVLSYINLGVANDYAADAATAIPPEISSTLGDLLKTSRSITGAFGLNSIDLPLGFDQSIKGNSFTLGITQMRLTPEGARGTIVAGLRIPQFMSENYIMFKASDVCLHPQGFGGNYTLSLTEDLHIAREDSNVYTLIFKSSGDRSCQLQMSCDGLTSLQIGGELLMPRTLMVPEESDGTLGSHKVKAGFLYSQTRDIEQDTMTELGANWMASIEFEKFQLTKLKGWSFDISEAYWDFSDLENPPGMVFPENFANADSTFQGIYIKNASIKPPKAIMNNQEDAARPAIQIANLIVDPALYMDLMVTNIIDIRGGNMDGWAFSMDTFRLRVNANTLQDGALIGKMHLPILDTTNFLAYNALVSDSDDAGYEFLFNVGLTDTVSFPLLLAKGNIIDDTYLEVNYSPSDPSATSVHAFLHATVTINTDDHDVDLPTNVTLPYLDATIGLDSRLGIIDEETAISFVGIFSPSESANPNTTAQSQTQTQNNKSKNVGGFPINLENFDVGLESIGNNEIGFSFQVALSLDIGEEDVGGVSAGFKIVSQMPEPSLENIGETLKTFKFKRVQFDSIALYANLGPVNVDGKLIFYNETNDQGQRNKGIYGEINAVIKAGVEISGSLSMTFGTFGIVPETEVSEFSETYYPYYKVDGQILISTGIMIATGVGFYGISGGISKNMAQSTVPEANGFGFTGSATYVPTYGAFGFGFGVTLGTHPDPQAFNADISFRADFINGGVDMINITGRGYVMCPIADRSDPTVFVEISLSLLMQRDDRPFSMEGILKVAINVGDGVLVGNMDGGSVPNQMVEASFHASRETWYFYMGEPEFDYNDGFDPRGSARLNLLGMIEADMKAYLMVGHGVPLDIPPLPPAIYNILNNPEGTFEGSSASTANAGLGGVDYSTGAGLANGAYVEIRAGIDAYALYANLNVYLGYDINITKRNSICASGDLIGINGWYAEGQAYTGLTGAVGIRFKLLGKEQDFHLFQLAAAIALNAGGPNPFYFTGRASVYYSLLNGKIKGSSTFGMSIGERCGPLNPDPFAGIDFYDYISPGQGEQDQFPGRSMQVKLALPVAEDLVIPNPVLDNNGDLVRVDNNRYRPELEWRIKRAGAHPDLVTNEYWVDEDSKTQLFITPTASLQRNTNYELILTVKAWDYQRNRWLRAVDADGRETGNIWTQDTTILFKTGGLPPDLYNYVAYTNPLPNERYFLQDNTPRGNVVFHQQINENFYFPASDPFGNYEYYVRFTNLNNEVKTDVPFTKYTRDNVDLIEFDVPELDNQAYYVMQVIRKKPGGIAPIARGNEPKRFKEIYSASSQSGNGAPITTTLEIEDEDLVSPEQVLQQNEFLLYHTFFRTSQFDKLADKLDQLNLVETEYYGMEHADRGKRVLVKYTTAEPFEIRDFNDFQISVGQGPPYNFKSRIGIFDMFDKSYHTTKVKPAMMSFKNELTPFAANSWPENTDITWEEPIKYRLPSNRIQTSLRQPITEDEYGELWSSLMNNSSLVSGTTRGGGAVLPSLSSNNFDIIFDTHYRSSKDKKTIVDYYAVLPANMNLWGQWPTNTRIGQLSSTNLKLNNANDGAFRFYFGRNASTKPNEDLVDIFNGKYKSFSTPGVISVINPR